MKFYYKQVAYLVPILSLAELHTWWVRRNAAHEASPIVCATRAARSRGHT